MKKLLLLLSLYCCITACSPAVYQQIATLKSEQVKIGDKGQFLADTPDFSVAYDFWAPYGTVAFVVKNKTDKDIYLNMSESYFIHNGYAYDYYLGRVYISSARTSLGATFPISTYSNSNKFNHSSLLSETSAQHQMNITTQTAGSSYAVGVEYVEQKIICIPARSHKHFEYFSVQPKPYRDCGFIRNPKTKESAELQFTAEDSPFVIENRLMFEVDGNKVPINHIFYVGKLQNVKESTVVEDVATKKCNGANSSNLLKFHKMLSPDRYYITYTSTHDDGDRTKDQH